jgi:hypothetical protein
VLEEEEEIETIPPFPTLVSAMESPSMSGHELDLNPSPLSPPSPPKTLVSAMESPSTAGHELNLDLSSPPCPPPKTLVSLKESPSRAGPELDLDLCSPPPPPKISVSPIESPSTFGHELNLDPSPPPSPPPKTPPSAPQVHAHIVVDMPLPSLPTVRTSTSTGQTLSQNDNSALPSQVLTVPEVDVHAYTAEAGIVDDDSDDDVDQFMDQFMEHYDRVDQEEDQLDDTNGLSLQKEWSQEACNDDHETLINRYSNGIRHLERHGIAIVTPDAVPSEPDIIRLSTTQYSSPSSPTTSLTTPTMTHSTSHALFNDDLTCGSPAAIAADPSKMTEDLSHKLHGSKSHAIHAVVDVNLRTQHSRTPSISSTSSPSSRFPPACESRFSESESESESDEDEDEDEDDDDHHHQQHDDDDDIPLAKSIPSALTAQKSIRHQVRQEREKRRQEKALRRQAESTRTRLMTLRPTVAPPSTSSSSQTNMHHHHLEQQQQFRRSRNHSLTSRSLSRSRNSLERTPPMPISELVPPIPISATRMNPDDHLKLFKSHHYAASLSRAGPIRISVDADKPIRATSQRHRRVPTSTSSPVNPSPVNTSKPELVVQQRVFISNMQRFNMVEIGESTTAGDVIEMIKADGALKDFAGSGGWMVFEVAQDFGMGTFFFFASWQRQNFFTTDFFFLERPIRSFELVSDVQASWNKDKMVNYLVLRMTPLDIALNHSVCSFRVLLSLSHCCF